MNSIGRGSAWLGKVVERLELFKDLIPLDQCRKKSGRLWVSIVESGQSCHHLRLVRLVMMGQGIGNTRVAGCPRWSRRVDEPVMGYFLDIPSD